MIMVEEQRRRQIMARHNDRGLLDQNLAARQSLTRREMLTGAALAAAGGLSTLALPGAALAANPGPVDLAGLWHDVISAADNSFAPFEVLELYGGGIWIGSGNADLSPASLSSSAWGIWERTGSHSFRVTGRWWTYKPNGTPTGFGTVSWTLTVSEDGNAYHGHGPVQFFDTKGKSLGAPTTQLLNATRITFS
jgi:hypothetical protein